MVKKHYYYYFILLFILGFLFRLLLSQLFPQPFEFDQEEYHRIAVEISRVGLYTHTYRLPGYSLLIAALYRIFGISYIPVKIAQALLDSATAFLVLLIGKKIIKNKTAPFLGLILYLFNPFTSAYTGVFLTEVVATFLLTLFLLLFLKFIKERSFKLMAVLGFVLGFLPQVRPSFLYFGLATLSWLIYLVIKEAGEKKHKFFYVAMLIGLYILPFIYNIAGNLKGYGEFQPLTVDNLLVREFYISLFIDSPQRTTSIPKEVNWIYQEYSLFKETSEERKAMAEKYFKLAIDKVRQDPYSFAITRFKKMWYVWEKHVIFPFNNPDSWFFNTLVYWGNVLLLLSGLYGFVSWTKEEIGTRKRVKENFALLVIVLFVYITVLHAFSITDERFSLPFYPLVALFGAFAISKIFRERK